MPVHRHRFHLFFAYVCPKTGIAVAVSSVTARLSVSFGILMKFIIFQKQRIISAVTFFQQLRNTYVHKISNHVVLIQSLYP